MDEKHPLLTWLENKGITLNRFSKDNELPTQTIYDQIYRKPRNGPSVRTMKAIEGATGGDVTVNMQIDWFSRQSQPEEQ